MIMKLICCGCQAELDFVITRIKNEGTTVIQEYRCPRCNKCIELWLI